MSFPNDPPPISPETILATLAIIHSSRNPSQSHNNKRTRVYRSSSCQINLVNFSLALISIALWVSPASGSVTVISQITNSSVMVFDDQPARFVPGISSYGIQGYVVYANPPNACTPLDPPPQEFYPLSVNWILLARRFECDFQRKIENAQKAGYAAIIVHNVDSNATESMGAENPSKLVIYACFIGEHDGEMLRDFYTFPRAYYVRIDDDFSMNGYLLPFAFIVGACFIVMLFFMVWQQTVRCLRERRRSRRRKLPASALKKLPVSKWTKGDPYETCAVCLEDFLEQDKIRVLPCSHGFHCVCIDPWLTKGRRVCPICKRKVILADERIPRSHTDSDTDDETAPLLSSTSGSLGQGPMSSSSSAPNLAASSTNTFVQPDIESIPRAQPQLYRKIRVRAQRPQLNAAESDGSSTSGSQTSESEGSLIRSHRSLPVLAQIHNHNQVGRELGQIEKKNTNTGSGFTTTTSTMISDPPETSRSQFYVPYPEEEEPSDEEILDVRIEPGSSPLHSRENGTTTNVNDVQVVLDGASITNAADTRSTIV